MCACHSRITILLVNEFMAMEPTDLMPRAQGPPSNPLSRKLNLNKGTRN